MKAFDRFGAAPWYVAVTHLIDAAKRLIMNCWHIWSFKWNSLDSQILQPVSVRCDVLIFNYFPLKIELPWSQKLWVNQRLRQFFCVSAQAKPIHAFWEFMQTSADAARMSLKFFFSVLDNFLAKFCPFPWLYFYPKGARKLSGIEKIKSNWNR